EFAIPVPLPPNLPGLDARVMRVESFPPDVTVPLSQGGAFKHWREKLEGLAVETTHDGFPALVAGGKLHYLCGWPDAAAADWKSALPAAVAASSIVPSRAMTAPLLRSCRPLPLPLSV
ncbi:MAG: hypothetical protein RL260_3600, partial [Pseudomonadota bacterium]